MTDARIKDVEVKPGVQFDMGGGRTLKTMAGSGGIVVFDDQTDVVALCARIMKFYAHESCGQCTPCREGTGWLARVCTRLAKGDGQPGDVDLLGQHRARHRRQHHLRARRGGGLADAGLPHQVPRRLRSQAQEGGLACNAGMRPCVGRLHRFLACSPAAVIGGAIFTMTRRNPVTAVMSLVGTFFALAGDLRVAVRALPGRDPDPGLRRRHHGALHLRGHDPEPRRGRARRLARPGPAQRSASRPGSTW